MILDLNIIDSQNSLCCFQKPNPKQEWLIIPNHKSEIQNLKSKMERLPTSRTTLLPTYPANALSDPLSQLPGTYHSSIPEPGSLS